MAFIEYDVNEEGIIRAYGWGYLLIVGVVCGCSILLWAGIIALLRYCYKHPELVDKILSIVT